MRMHSGTDCRPPPGVAAVSRGRAVADCLPCPAGAAAATRSRTPGWRLAPLAAYVLLARSRRLLLHASHPQLPESCNVRNYCGLLPPTPSTVPCLPLLAPGGCCCCPVDRSPSHERTVVCFVALQRVSTSSHAWHTYVRTYLCTNKYRCKRRGHRRLRGALFKRTLSFETRQHVAAQHEGRHSGLRPAGRAGMAELHACTAISHGRHGC